ncbi:MAG: YraN family protein [Patescibacteria group bacterium]
MDISTLSTKEVGNLGEKLVADYLKHEGYRIVAKNVVRKTGEIDVIAQKGNVLHFVEVKTIVCREFPKEGSAADEYDPSANLHAHKIQKVARTSEWYVMDTDWEGDWQVDGALVWLRARDGASTIEHLPQIL